MKRYFEFVGVDLARASGRAEKFWELSVEATQLTIRFGKIGANGQTTVKSFKDSDTALREAEKLIAEKLRKGYSEVHSPPGAPSQVKPSKGARQSAPTPREKVAAWITNFGIHRAVDAEDNVTNDPLSLGWNKDYVWTWWDTGDETGSYVESGYQSDNRFISSWFLGTKPHGNSKEIVVLIDRNDCPECDAEGCDACDGYGWIEEDYISELGSGIDWDAALNDKQVVSGNDRNTYPELSSSTTECVACAEPIRSHAKLCKHCGTMQDDPKFTNNPVNNQVPTAESNDDDEYELTEMDNLCTDAMVQLGQLVENDNLERIRIFTLDKSLICDVCFEYEVIDTAFPEALARMLTAFHPQDDDGGDPNIKHVYLEPDDFFAYKDEDTGFALLKELFELAGCENSNDVQSQNVLRNKRGPKGFYMFTQMK